MTTKTKNERLADKYPVKYSRDGGPESNRLHPDGRVTLGYLIMTFADFAESLKRPFTLKTYERLADWLDREFLFGAWGHVMHEVREHDFGRDINSFIVAAFAEGQLRCPHCRERHALKQEKLAPPAVEEWYWREKDSETASGPFSSRKEAIEEARGSTDSRVVSIGCCIYPDPVHAAQHVIDLAGILDNMEDFQFDNDYPFDDRVFEVDNESTAEEVLKRVVGAWARVHFKPCTSWHTSGQEEEVEINPEVDER